MRGKTSSPGFDAPPPVERVLFGNERVEVGAFRCPAEHSDFRHAGGPIRDHYVFAFPRTRVWIRQSGSRAFATDSTIVTLYNPGQEFERGPLDRAGDTCEWYAVDTESAFEVARALDPAVEDRPKRAFRFSHGPSDALTYLAQRELYHAIAQGEAPEPFAVEEAVLRLLERVLQTGYAAWGARLRKTEGRVAGDDHEAVRRACVVLGERFRDPISLADVARSVGLSRYRLCRLFRAAAGTTMHAYREQLRLRAALEALAGPSADLTEIALDLGYSSHSHFTSHFRRVFGVPPSLARGRLARQRNDRGRYFFSL